MKNIFRSIVMAALIMVSACNDDLLNPIPRTTFSEAVVFDSPEKADQLLNGLYATLITGQFYGSRYMIYNDIRAEDFINRTTNGVTGLSTWQHTLVSTTNEVQNLWSVAYLLINRANIFMDGVEKNADKIGGQEKVQEYQAHARFLRGLAYFSLLQLYARPYADNNGNHPGLPLRIQPELDDTNNSLARSTVAEVYSQIINDLNFAEQNLNTTNGSALKNTTLAHKNTAIALKTRVYLAMGQYENVIVEADKIVSQSAPYSSGNGVPHMLQENISDVFTPPYTSTENIFSAPFTEMALPGTQNGLGSYYNPGPRGNGDYSLNMSNGIFTLSVFDPNQDARAEWMFENTSNGFIYLNKFPRGPQHLDYAPIIRYAEVLLNLSEALVRSGGDESRALSLLNSVRTRSNPSGAYTQFSSQNSFVEAILLERRLEFIGEGLRNFDLQRTLSTIPGKENIQPVPPSSPNYIWPISAVELLTNSQMTPNN
ncbi:RagB/SusD family nutrient uptake outer membrane protein [Arthrospiribacter ruber]|uniref:RagB/SusD family nutrient uptake outer membrane protein n=1 Tax=Arthrospiribacter ruber TaxID=2487934 RepID=A0A951J030_9BACT|nr:RagB/SusD family nutrient uptake outer membrane protein [Arthrospiribacter ruber]MBW3470285.1 RagB/SusD family nutrient uptake outer membrane protein [Arthrospiribacter ruber]